MAARPTRTALGETVEPRIFAPADGANPNKRRGSVEHSFDRFSHGRLDIARLERRVEAAFATATFEEAFVGDFKKLVNAGDVGESFVPPVIEHVHDEEHLLCRTRCRLDFVLLAKSLERLSQLRRRGRRKPQHRKENLAALGGTANDWTNKLALPGEDQNRLGAAGGEHLLQHGSRAMIRDAGIPPVNLLGGVEKQYTARRVADGLRKLSPAHDDVGHSRLVNGGFGQSTERFQCCGEKRGNAAASGTFIAFKNHMELLRQDGKPLLFASWRGVGLVEDVFEDGFGLVQTDETSNLFEHDGEFISCSGGDPVGRLGDPMNFSASRFSELECGIVHLATRQCGLGGFDRNVRVSIGALLGKRTAVHVKRAAGGKHEPGQATLLEARVENGR